MLRFFRRLGLVLTALTTVACGDAPGPEPTSATDERPSTSHDATIDDKLASFRTSSREVLARGEAPARLEVGATHLEVAPDLTRRLAAGVRLPRIAHEAFSVRAVTPEHAPMQIDVRLAGALPRPARIVGDRVIYDGGLGEGTAMVSRFREDGAEDFVYLERAPQTASLEYRVHLTAGVAGARLVANVLELLNASGEPLLRVPPPIVYSATGATLPALLSVDGCAVDTDPRAPWGRPVTPPGAEECVVRVSWDGAAVRYPALVDPAWTTTANMITGRYGHATVQVAPMASTSATLVAGGADASYASLASAELYNGSTWTATSSMAVPRGNELTGTKLANGRVLVVGGWTDAFDRAEVYDPATGLWSKTAPSGYSGGGHGATLLQNGRVLVAGGTAIIGVASATIAAARIYDPSTNAWTQVAPMPEPVRYHGQSILQKGLVLVAGGVNDASWASRKTCYLYWPSQDQWTVTGSMTYGRSHFTTTTLTNGKVLALGGAHSSPVSELYSVTPGTWSGAAMVADGRSRNQHVAVALPDGRVLVAGGYDLGSFMFLQNTMLYTPSTNTWSNTAGMSERRAQPGAALLPSGNVLVTGGANLSPALASTEAYAP